MGIVCFNVCFNVGWIDFSAQNTAISMHKCVSFDQDINKSNLRLTTMHFW